MPDEIPILQQMTMKPGQPEPKKTEPEDSRAEMRRRMEDLLRETEDRFRRLAENARDLIFRMSLPDCKYEYVSPSAYDITGFTPEEHYKGVAGVKEQLHPDSMKYFDEQWENLFKGEMPPFYEYKIVHRDGGERWLRQSNVLVRDENGTPIALEGIVTDITDRSSAEQALKEREQHYRAVFENTGAATIIVEKDTTISLCNAEFENLSGYSRREIEGKKSWTEFVAKEDLDRMLKQHRLRRDNRDQASKRYEFQFVSRTGEFRHIYIMVDTIPGTEKSVASLTDITDRKRMEEELRMHRDHLGELVAERTEQLRQEVVRRREREEQYLSLVESVEEWIWETDENFVHTYLSSRIFDILGYGPRELIGKSPADIMPADEVRRAMPLIKKIISQKEKFISFENVCFHKDGHKMYIEANGRPFFDAKGNFLGYRGSCRDVTEKKKAMDSLKERELELLSKSKTLEEVNVTLGVLLKQRDRDRRELEEVFVSNIREMVLPYITRIQKDRPDPRHKAYLDIVAANLNEIISPFLNTVRQLSFTPKEIEVSSLIKEGKTTKEIAELMGVAPSAVDSHRNNIRVKLGLNNKKSNLRSYLLSLK